jgi:hypothetical protein
MADGQIHSKVPDTNSVRALQSDAGNKTHHNVQVQAPAKDEVTTPNATAGGKQWRTSSLHWGWLIFVVLIEAGLIATILYFEKQSASGNGIVSIPQVSVLLASSYFSISNVWRYGLLWTTLPSLIMTIYRIMWDTIVSGASDRQPFVEFKRLQKNPTPGDSTLNFKLDYKSYPSFFAWTVALRNGDIHLGLPMLLSLVLSIAIVPLAAHLIVAAPSQSGSSVALSFTKSFNESALTPVTSLQPALDLATANRIYGATPPSWMTLEYAFEAFEVGEGSTSTGNVTAETNAYSAQLDCQTFPESSATYSDSPISGGEVDYNMNDRGCEVSGFLTVSNNTPTYIKAWQSNCAGSEYGRIGIIAGTYSNESSIKLANYSLISCAVWYWNTSGSITVSLQPSVLPQFISFSPNTSISIHPWQIYQQLENTFYKYSFFDASNSIDADAFGFSVYSYAQAQNPASPITPNLIKNCTEDLFQTLYAGLAAKILLQDNGIPQAATGELSTAVTRLYVVTPVAYTIVGVLLLALICNIILLIYTYMTKSILMKEPFVLAGEEGILNQSHNPQLVSDYWREKVHPKVPMMKRVLCHNAATASNREKRAKAEPDEDGVPPHYSTGAEN